MQSNLYEYMVAVPIKHEAITLQEKFYTIQRVAKNKNTQQASYHIQ
jgi:hypothetical protein